MSVCLIGFRLNWVSSSAENTRLLDRSVPSGCVSYDRRGRHSSLFYSPVYCFIGPLTNRVRRHTDLREHALFTLRNLLHENAENQAVVDAIKPMGAWDENGILRDTPGTRK